jgi:DNA-binding GntR family transcriptional regulator
VRLDHASPLPLYHQAARALEEAIEDGRLPRGSKLASELYLAEKLGISRPTMRAAIKQLVDKGLLIRRRGIGTIVMPKPVRRAVALTSLYDDLKEAGREPRTRVLALEEVPCSPEIAEHLGLEPAASVMRFDRLRLAGSDPIALMHNVVPAGLLKIGKEDLEQTGLYELFRKSRITPHVATQRVGARKAGAREAELLEIEPGDPVLTMNRITYDTSGRPIEYGSHCYPAESYWLEMMLVEVRP